MNYEPYILFFSYNTWITKSWDWHIDVAADALPLFFRWNQPSKDTCKNCMTFGSVIVEILKVKWRDFCYSVSMNQNEFRVLIKHCFLMSKNTV